MLHAVIIAVAVTVTISALGIALGYFLRYRRLRIHYGSIIDVEAHIATARQELEDLTKERQHFVANAHIQRTQLTEQYRQALVKYQALKREVSLLEENLEDISFGLYRPHFRFDTSAQYKDRLDALRAQQRDSIRSGLAAICSTRWEVGGSQREGERMAKQNTKLVLRAFNGECDSAVAKVSWNNVTTMEERIYKSFDAINKLGTVLHVSITEGFRDLKVDELRLTHEYEEKRYQEQEEQRRVRAQMRDDERAQRELDRAREEAEQEEVRFEKALQAARAEAARATGGKLQELNERVSLLQAQLEEAHTRKDRAISRAEQTRSGHVYIISNVGSFGEHVYKVGMTRRLDPEERIRELGDASVPFPFDVHAMIYSEDAPKLEGFLHEQLERRRVNWVNARKEFFQVMLEEIEGCAKGCGLTVEFTRLAEAREYRQTVTMRAQERTAAPVTEVFSARLFANASPESATGERR